MIKNKKIILNATAAVHRAVKTVSAVAGKSINDFCLSEIERNPEVRKVLTNGK